MPAYTADAVQTVQPNGFAIFTTTVVPCELGLIQHIDGTPIFSLSGWRPYNTCPCKRNTPVEYGAIVNMNVALSEGATVAPITVALTVDGVPLSMSEMDSTPAAVQEFNHIGTDVSLPILSGCCQIVAIQNLSTQPIDIKNLGLKFNRSDLGCNG